VFVPCHSAAAGQSANWKTELLENMEKCKCQWVNGKWARRMKREREWVGGGA